MRQQQSLAERERACARLLVLLTRRLLELEREATEIEVPYDVRFFAGLDALFRADRERKRLLFAISLLEAVLVHLHGWKL